MRGKILLLYKNQNGRSTGWVLPKGSLEPGESYKAAALREVKEESGVTAKICKYIGRTRYSFYSNTQPDNTKITKTVHWYLMTTNSYNCKPQAEEFFADAGFYKQHEAYHLLKFHDEREVMLKAFKEYTMSHKAFHNNNFHKRRDGATNVQTK